MSSIFKNKVALVTGGTSGIGRATAIDFAKQGAKVVITGRREEEGRKTVDLITQAGGEAQFFRADVSIEKECKDMVDNTISKFGRLDFAFNNAGIEGVIAPLTEQTDENFHQVMNINVLGVMNSMKYEIPAMIKNGGGSIVNTASIASMIGMEGISVYCASKAALLGLTRVASLEYAKQGIRVNTVSPAAIQTEMIDRFTGNDKDAKAGLAAAHPLGRIGTADEIANPVTFLCSPGASFITGTNLPIDGGFTVQ